MTPVQKLICLLALIVALMAGSAVATWLIQDWRFGKQLADQARLHADDLTAISNATSAQQQADLNKRVALEQRLSASDQNHHKELSDAQTNQARLRDRLATSDLRLSVLLAEDPASGCAVPTGAATGSVVHGRARARLDPAHAQRIVAITDAGDQGLIALRACQAYVREFAR
ncbi:MULTISPECIES: lysis system i-spanin subunit Rz [Pseudomonas]|uniref:lysis system i-spanin subunit Rz n=1 Tax=Pseudomonas TaxID=286 RepID=UPI000C86B3E1|nr:MULTISPECIES: lysis system i-spanin subunit Rz [Pseudomonas]MBA4361977.1 lysis protein [Pseudomonas sp.]MSU92913.1 lysis protein [Pseudomonas mandelii]PMV78528.1 lysis protein [Pseudomonas sp. GW101-1A09]PMV83048.1 lysis protein [Pseudomonas sp. FW306-2-2C-B10A]PMV88714.1 lysis protein [Pseudomonas sp. GW460-C8]